MEIYRKWITGCFWNQIRGLTGKGQKGTLAGDENTPYTDGVCATWLCAFVKTGPTIHLRSVHFIVYMLFLNYEKHLNNKTRQKQPKKSRKNKAKNQNGRKHLQMMQPTRG